MNRGILANLPAAWDPVLREIVDQNLLGKHFVEVVESEATALLSCMQIENRCLYVPSKDDGFGFLTALATTYEHD